MICYLGVIYRRKYLVMPNTVAVYVFKLNYWGANWPLLEYGEYLKMEIEFVHVATTYQFKLKTT